ncbi:hypothetical protein D8674_041737 [Pyrus ussuriensis x Pyrus communis]|uniref:Uncharacterized protein n=1 Tax=Pyrus ussuriensis x Pyrus communis TaxID=2448454 RepID=A0A5N5GVY0_9ROSA|nr:hypothetical protein D8674_041737 [Pyrus ussuriensis x Pyrus communis]
MCKKKILISKMKEKKKAEQYSASVPVICALELFLWPPLLSSLDTHTRYTNSTAYPSSFSNPKLHFSFLYQLNLLVNRTV